ncbi:hypothetical protein Tco_0303092, partial [Tanacetum coccineum]
DENNCTKLVVEEERRLMAAVEGGVDRSVVEATVVVVSGTGIDQSRADLKLGYVWHVPQMKLAAMVFFSIELEVRIKGGKEKEIKKCMRNRNSCPLCGCTDHNKRTCTGMFKDQDEVVVAQDEVVQEKVDLVENEE